MEDEKKKKHGHGFFQPGSVRVVDYDNSNNNNNILVRGSSAFGAINQATGQPFALSDLISAIQADANFSATGITLSATPMIIDFCLIGYGSHKDEHIVEAEIKWFTGSDPSPIPPGNGGSYPYYYQSSASGNPNTMFFWPVQSIGGTPPETAGGSWNPSPSPSIESGSSNCNFAGLIPAIRAALTNTISTIASPPPNVTAIQNAIIYVHCDSGVNRTGAAVAAYLMMYGTDVTGMSLARNTGASPYTLQQGQNAANLAAPSDDTNPPGGWDIPVASAYCNFVVDGNFNSLNANCVPLPNTNWP